MTAEVIPFKRPDRAKKSVPLRLELLALVDDVGSVLVLQQLCYWTSRSKDPRGWVFKTYEELASELGVNRDGKPIASDKTIGRKLARLEELGLIQSRIEEHPAGRIKSYRVRRENIQEIDDAIEASRGPSSIVHTGPPNPPDKLSGGSTERDDDDDGLEVAVDRVPGHDAEIPEESDTHQTDCPVATPPHRTNCPDPPDKLSGVTESSFREFLSGDHPRAREDFDEWLRMTFERHGHRVSVALCQSMAMRLAGEGDREFVEHYVLTSLVNMDGEPTNKIVRALQQGQRIDIFRTQSTAKPGALGTQQHRANRLEVRGTKNLPPHLERFLGEPEVHNVSWEELE